MDQLNKLTDVIVDKKNDSIIIYDSENRRVVRWSRRNSTNGQTIISDIDFYDLTMDNNGHLYVSEHRKGEVRRWKIGETTELVAKIKLCSAGTSVIHIYFDYRIYTNTFLMEF
jgi:hypothetical protein